MTQNDRFDENLFGTGVTARWLSKVMVKADDESEKLFLTNFKAEQIGIGVGFLSHILRVGLEWDTHTPKLDQLPKSVIIKAPTTDKIQEKLVEMNTPEEMHGMILDGMAQDLLRRYHKAECDLYALSEQDKRFNVAVPRCFLSQDTGNIRDGKLIMEDLSSVSSLGDFYSGMTIEQVYAVIGQLIELHAYCFSTEDWKTKFVHYPDHHFAEWDNFWEQTMMGFDQLGQSNFKDQCLKFRHHFTSANITKVVNEYSSTLNLPEVIVHGDTWINNLLFRRKSPGSEEISNELVAVIDWQMLHVGNFAADIAILLVSSITADLRRNNTRKILQYYHQKLCEKIGKQPFSYDDVLRTYNHVFCFPVGLYILFWTGLMSSNAKDGDPKQKDKIGEVFTRGAALLEDMEKVYNKEGKLFEW